MLMSLAEEFVEFWRKNRFHYQVNNEREWIDRLKGTIQRIDEEGGILDVKITKLDEALIDSNERGKERKRRVLLGFYEHLKDKGIEVVTVLDQKRFYDNVLDRQLAIAKYMHKRRTINEIAEAFSVSHDTVENDLRALDEGIELLGATIKLKREKIGTSYYYSSTVHPVFLPLNLSEAYALTAYLKNMTHDTDPNADMIRYLTDRIEAQLSDYAFEAIYKGAKKRTEFSNDFRSEEELSRERMGIIGKLMKTGAPFRFFYHEEPLSGRITMDTNGYYVEADDGRRFEINDIEWIADSQDI